ncbi:aminomethyltransferase [Arthrobacter sp. RIT-PI-e]|uniref:CAF17-like 4Fe-4S cluster assembly/insertion protein YgfZ n=1 Tax=Arthrobacter sp. RIT-PI-e TaxID=1681197 RepID=UPI0006768ACC|nr:glycine cleavage T C-terminal barrel domain-containing protein [Arthrobacter sp. RIT-PI-e]KNC19956.1 aminomethyltransferase [Arthrobacter sp. RIT-PI-e]
MISSSPLLARPGAVPGGGADALVASHYGDPFREQRLLAEGQAVVDLSSRGVVTVSGPDRLSWLNTLSSQLLLGLVSGQSSETLLLTVQGRIEHAAHVVDDGGTTWLIVEGGEAAPLAAWLERMKFMLRVEVTDATGAWAVLGATRALPELGEGRIVWEDPWPAIGAGGYAYSTVDAAAHPGVDRPWFEYLVPRAELDTVVTSSELQLSGSLAAEALRIAAWRPRPGFETDEKTIPHELDLMRTAVHLAKGCYKGQETVARVHNLGHPPRRLTFLHLDGSQHTLPAPGSAVVSEGRTVGRVTSVGHHYEMGPVALAVLKRSVDASAELLVQDADETYAAAQEVIVAPDAGQVVGRATGFLRVPR